MNPKQSEQLAGTPDRAPSLREQADALTGLEKARFILAHEGQLLAEATGDALTDWIHGGRMRGH